MMQKAKEDATILLNRRVQERETVLKLRHKLFKNTNINRDMIALKLNSKSILVNNRSSTLHQDPQSLMEGFGISFGFGSLLVLLLLFTFTILTQPAQ